MSARWIAIVSVLLSTAVGASYAHGAPDEDLLGALLDASGVADGTARERQRGAFEALVTDLRDEIGDARPTVRRARRLYRLLHSRHLREYRDDADGIDAILDRGEFNCVSGSLFVGLVGRRLGFDVSVVEGPQHLLALVRVEGRDVLVETTSPKGFDVLRRPSHPGGASPYGLLLPPELRSPASHTVYGASAPVLQPVGLEAAVAYVWHNAGQRALARGEPLLAARAFQEEHRRHPGLAARSESLATALARAFRLEYDQGRFEEAQRIAEIDLAIYPGRTTGRDRLLAAALKRLLQACEAGDPGTAEAILDTLGSADLTEADVARLEWEAAPRIVAEAVRLRQWERAVRLAARYAAVERDPVESERLTRWVRERRAGTADALPRALPHSG